jgi:hypothetical protein
MVHALSVVGAASRRPLPVGDQAHDFGSPLLGDGLIGQLLVVGAARRPVVMVEQSDIDVPRSMVASEPSQQSPEPQP